MDPITFNNKKGAAGQSGGNLIEQTYVGAGVGILNTSTPQTPTNFSFRTIEFNPDTPWIQTTTAQGSFIATTTNFVDYKPYSGLSGSAYGYSYSNGIGTGVFSYNNNNYILSKMVHEPFSYVDISLGNISDTMTSSSAGQYTIAKSDDGSTIVAAGPKSGTTADYFHVMTSTNGGDTWKKIDVHLFFDDSHQYDPYLIYSENKFTLIQFAATNYVFESADGLSWTQVDYATNGTGVLGSLPVYAFRFYIDNVFIGLPSFTYSLYPTGGGLQGSYVTSSTTKTDLGPEIPLPGGQWVRSNVFAVKTVSGVPQDDVILHAGSKFLRVYDNGTSIVQDEIDATNVISGNDKIPFAMFYRESDSSYYVMISDLTQAVTAGYGLVDLYKSSDDGATWTQVGTPSIYHASWETYQMPMKGLVGADCIVATAGQKPVSDNQVDSQYIRYNFNTDTWDSEIHNNANYSHSFMDAIQTDQTTGDCIVVGSTNLVTSTENRNWIAKAQISSTPVGYKIPLTTASELTANTTSYVLDISHSLNGTDWITAEHGLPTTVPSSSSTLSLGHYIWNDGETISLDVNITVTSYRTDNGRSYYRTARWDITSTDPRNPLDVNGWVNTKPVKNDGIESIVVPDLDSTSTSQLMDNTIPTPTSLSYEYAPRLTSSYGGGKYATDNNMPFAALSACIVDANTWLVGCSKKKLYKTTDGGVTWTALSDNGLESLISSSVSSNDNVGIQAVEVSDDGLTIVVTTTFGYIFVSSDGGSTWSENSSFRTQLGINIISRNANMSNLRYVNGVFFFFSPIGSLSDFYYSTDGLTWTKKTINTGTTYSGRWQSVTYNETTNKWAFTTTGARTYVVLLSDLTSSASAIQISGGQSSWAGTTTWNGVSLPNIEYGELCWNNTESRWELYGPNTNGWVIYYYSSDFTGLSVGSTVFWSSINNGYSLGEYVLTNAPNKGLIIAPRYRLLSRFGDVDETNSFIPQFANGADSVTTFIEVWDHHSAITTYATKGDLILIGGESGELCLSTDWADSWTRITTLRTVTETVSRKPTFNLTWLPSASLPSYNYLANVEVVDPGYNVFVDNNFNYARTATKRTRSDSSEFVVYNYTTTLSSYNTTDFLPGKISIDGTPDKIVYVYERINTDLFRNYSNVSNVPSAYISLDGGITTIEVSMQHGTAGQVSPYFPQSTPIYVYTRITPLNLNGTMDLYFVGWSGTSDGTTATFVPVIHKGSLNATNDGFDIDQSVNFMSSIATPTSVTASTLFSTESPVYGIYASTSPRTTSKSFFIAKLTTNMFGQMVAGDLYKVDGNFSSITPWVTPTFVDPDGNDITTSFDSVVPTYNMGVGKWFMVATGKLAIASSYDLVDWDLAYDPGNILV